jgi:hypothetical protein
MREIFALQLLTDQAYAPGGKLSKGVSQQFLTIPV